MTTAEKSYSFYRPTFLDNTNPPDGSQSDILDMVNEISNVTSWRYIMKRSFQSSTFLYFIRAFRNTDRLSDLTIELNTKTVRKDKKTSCTMGYPYRLCKCFRNHLDAIF